MKYLLKKLFAYQKAYSGNILWPLILPLRQLQLKQVANKASLFLESGWVLDIGTAYGYLPIEIARGRPKIKVIGIDVQLELISDGIQHTQKKQISNRVSFLRAGAESLPFKDSTFDMVVSTMSLHLWNDQQEGIIEIQRVLKSGGQALILVGSYYLLNGFARITDPFTKKSINKMAIMLTNAAFKEFKVDYVDSILIITARK